MRLSRMSVEVTADDLNSWLAALAPDAPVRVHAITPVGVHGQLKLWFWYIDFVAVPSCQDGVISLDIRAHKLVPIPAAWVQRQLREVVKDSPPGIEAFQQSLRVHLPSLCAPFGISLRVCELSTRQDVLCCVLEDLRVEPGTIWNRA
ncbi:hypothetical protein GCM10010885_15340 [Alicyclobacillus cellulosilyticus]|uniref:Uncharacterized protein n=1 Tax=Alicyclobacillus cellulosilyticus TaxID=1003997 RepID=A0A917KBD4_9BACL|nr:hypothetical protein [Alicyclobacillus cellulosilyticus]GGJ07106.1 hypothetical protein GCM10010885_15340 [Alicyclobacillus cellulosilyticus]